MASIQIGKYKRPGIFIEEFDNSVIATPTVTGTTTMVIGFSKKGPVNTPVLLNNVTDLEKIFGSLDRNLERKGSYFYRTVSKMLESSPVYAMNLLNTSDILDTIEYKSVSTSTDKTNDVIRNGAYRKFFDTTSFWKRDTDSFITLTSGDSGQANRLLSFTNMSDKYVTIFVFKSQMTGFDISMIQYYGTADKIPAYVNQLDYASDYMVDVVIVGGDWSNYNQLSVDNIWSQYFTSEGLIKSQISNFANNRNVNLLGYYEGLSLIPYFRDTNGRNVFIETVINNDTDMTGVFCAFNADKLEGDYPNGMVDLIGNNLVNYETPLALTGQASIDFLSYKANIIDTIDFNQVRLDRADGVQQVIALGGTAARTVQWGDTNRTAYYAEKFINGVNYETSSKNFSSTASIELGFAVNDADLGGGTTASSYCVIGGNTILVNGGLNGTYTFSISKDSYVPSTSTQSYTSVFYINSSTGNIEKKDGTTNGSAPSLATNDLVLGFVGFSTKNGFFATSSIAYTDVCVDDIGFSEFAAYTASVSGTQVTVEFSDTAATDLTNNYVRHRSISLFNSLIGLLDSSSLSTSTLLADTSTYDKLGLSSANLVSYVTSTTANKKFTIDLGSTVPTSINDGRFIIYKTDDEFILGTDGVNTRLTVATPSYGIAARYSDFYDSFYTGTIGTGDYLYKNISDLDNRIVFINTGTSSYLVVETAFDITEQYSTVFVSDSTLNTSTYKLDGEMDASLLIDPDTGTGFVGYQGYNIFGANVTNEDITVSEVYNVDTKVYLKMYTDASGNLITKFVDSNLSSTEQITTKDLFLRVISEKSNYRQSIEIEEPTGYTPVVNQILINGSRYTEVKVGDFLEADVDVENLEVGQMPRNLTRILRKVTYSPDPTLVVVTCDAAIRKVLVNGEYQTNRYTSIDDYVTTYQAIPLKGFRVREESMPDGTETRQNSILNLVAKGTSLFKAVTNKEAIDFRYLVDSFGLGLTERSKQQLVDICGERLDCLGFISMPSMKQFKNSTNPSFLNEDGVLDTAYIASGGNLESNPSFLYSFGDGSGVSSTGYFLPYVTVSDNGRPTDVPPAPFVATTYMRKQNATTDSIVPWTIAAGVTNGRVLNISGLEINFTPSDIENLNLAQMNPIVFKRNRGFVIETENTAQTLYKSALSFLHVREVLIELERELSAMLLDFQWRFNTSDVRAEIKLRADVICEKYINRNGLYAYFNKCDDENNTTTIIDNQIGVLDTYVEPIKGMGVIVNNITILRTGGIASGGFQ